MKLKALKNLKLDVSGSLASRFKWSRSFKDIKNNTYFKLSRILKRRKIKKNSIFKLRYLMSRIKFANKHSKSLDFNSANTKNVFLRTKRKSSFGQTLLEKQRLKSIIPYINEKEIKSYFDNGNNSILNRMDYIFNISNIFVSKDFIKSKIVLKDNFYGFKDIYSYCQDIKDIKYAYCKMNYTANRLASFSAPLFDRILPSNLLFDIRLNKIKVLNGDNVEGFSLPFDFNIKKVIQHYRLKRS